MKRKAKIEFVCIYLYIPKLMTVSPNTQKKNLEEKKEEKNIKKVKKTKRSTISKFNESNPYQSRNMTPKISTRNYIAVTKSFKQRSDPQTVQINDKETIL